MIHETYISKALEKDDGNWVKHTDWHWSRFVAGKRLDYWPSKSKFQYEGRVIQGNVIDFIKAHEKEQ